MSEIEVQSSTYIRRFLSVPVRFLCILAGILWNSRNSIPGFQPESVEEWKVLQLGVIDQIQIEHQDLPTFDLGVTKPEWD